METSLKIGLIGTIITIVLATFVGTTIAPGGDGENLSAMIKLILGMIPLAVAIGTMVAVFRFK